MKYVKQLHQCHSSSIQSFELLFSNVGGVPDFFCYLGAHAKIWNPATTPSGILVTAARVRRLIPKIVAYISCSVGRTHFAWTKNAVNSGHLVPWQRMQAARANLKKTASIAMEMTRIIKKENLFKKSVQVWRRKPENWKLKWYNLSQHIKTLKSY